MNAPQAFHPLARLLHWTMAVLILAMLFVGVGMVTTVSEKHQWLLALHRPLGAAIWRARSSPRASCISSRRCTAPTSP